MQGKTMRQSGLAGHEKRAEEVDRGYRAYFEHNRAYDGYLIAKYRLTEALRNGKIFSYITVGDIGGI